MALSVIKDALKLAQRDDGEWPPRHALDQMKLSPKNLLDLLRRALDGWRAHKCLRLGASLAFYTIFAIAPLFLIALAIAGFFFGEQAARQELFAQLHGLLGDQGGQAVQAVVASARQPGAQSIAAALAVAAFFIGATGVFVELQDALNTIWQVRRKPGTTLLHFIKDRLISFAMMMAIGFLLLVSLVVSTALAAFSKFVNDRLWFGVLIDRCLAFAISLAMIALLFAMIFRVLPDVKIPWRGTWLGACFSALLFQIGKYGLGLYLGHSSISSSYGAAGSFVILLMWVYYSSQTLFLGAEFTRACSFKFFPRSVEAEKHSEFVRPAEGALPPAGMEGNQNDAGQTPAGRRR